jgi:hypothetical protein
MSTRPGFITKLISTTLILLGLLIVIEARRANAVMALPPPGTVISHAAPIPEPDPAQPQDVKILTDVDQDYYASVRVEAGYMVPYAVTLYQTEWREIPVYPKVFLGRLNAKTLPSLLKKLNVTNKDISDAIDEGKKQAPYHHLGMTYRLYVKIWSKASASEADTEMADLRFTIRDQQKKEQVRVGKLTFKITSDGQAIKVQYLLPAADAAPKTDLK